MSEKNIFLSTYAKEDGLFKISASILFENIDEVIKVPDNNHINLYNYPLSDGRNLRPRETGDHIKVSFKLVWERGAGNSDIQRLVEEKEKAYEVLLLRVYALNSTCKWCSEQIQIPSIEIGSEKQFEIIIPLSEVKGIVTVVGDITRQTSIKTTNTFKATESYTIVSSAEQISIQIDEVKEIGGNYLPIRPEHIGELVFDLFGFENDFQLPVVRYSEELKQHFTNDDLITTNATFFAAIPYFLDHYLKWLIFVCKYDYSDKNHRGLLELFSKYCDISKSELIEVMEKEKYCIEQVKYYYNLSHKLFKGIQYNRDFKYKQELNKLFKREINQFV